MDVRYWRKADLVSLLMVLRFRRSSSEATLRAGQVYMPPSSRINSIDALRGLALFGVLAMNLDTAFRISLFEQFLPGTTDRGISGPEGGAALYD